MVKSPLTLVLAISFEYDTKNTSNKRKNKKAGLHQTEDFIQPKKRKTQHEKATCRMGEKYLQNTYLIRGLHPK